MNEVRMEYLTFCSNCNAVLKDNYREWTKRNPEKTFSDFLTIICISKQQIDQKAENIAEDKKFKSKDINKSLQAAFVFCIHLVISFCLFVFFVSHIPVGNELGALAQEYKTFFYGVLINVLVLFIIWLLYKFEYRTYTFILAALISLIVTSLAFWYTCL